MNYHSLENNGAVQPLAPGGWHGHAAALLIPAVLGLAVCSQRIDTARGFLTDDCTHLEYSYQNGLRTSPSKYLPGVVAHRRPPPAEAVRVVSGIVLAVILALTVVSDARGADGPDHPYYSEYSFRVLGRSFGYFIATLFFHTDNPTPMRPPAAYIILFFTALADCRRPRS